MQNSDQKKLLRDSSDFQGITPEKLRDLFDIERIQDGTSRKVFSEELGGTSGLLKLLKCDQRVGISKWVEELESRKQSFGDNLPIVRPQKSLFVLIWEQLCDFVIRVLIVAAIVSLGIGLATHPEDGWLEGVAIMVAIMIVVGVGAGNNWLKAKQFEKLNQKMDEKLCIVIRDGEHQAIKNIELVVGDIVQVSQGLSLPADGVLLAANALRSDQSNVNGESKPVRKTVLSSDERDDPFLISGSKIEVGNGQMLVCAVGRYSFTGQQMILTQGGEEEETPLQTELGFIALDIGLVGTGVAALTVFALTIHLLVDAFAMSGGWGTEHWAQFLSSFIIGITVIVVAIPEGLPLAVTISLAFSINKMRKENNLVRHLHACENMGCVNNICSDKTGTITENKMHVAKLWFDKVLYDKTDFAGKVIDANIKSTICENVSVNSTALIDHTSHDTGKEPELIGDRTECALLLMTQEMGKDFHYIRKDNNIVHSFPFDSSTKMMTTMVNDSDPAEEDRYRVYVKGAPDWVLQKCTRILRHDNKVVPLEEAEKETITEMFNKDLAAEGLRTILIAYRIMKDETSFLEQEEDDRDRDYLEQDLVFVAIAGIEDAIRQGVPESVLVAQRAGITVRMITGDHPATAVVFSKRSHILPSDYQWAEGDGVVMTGKEFEEKITWKWEHTEDGQLKGEVTDLEAFDEMQDRLRVIARSTYQHKYMLVTGLKQLESVVAVTGDGTNDAAALKQSDVGLAMNLVGTDIAKAASDIILLDDNFTSIITAVKWGRNIYDCIRKFLQFQLTVSLVALTLVFIGAISVESSPLTAVQMLWINLIMNSMAALALATEPPNDDLLKRMPTRRTEYIVTIDMGFTIIGQVIYQVIILLFILFASPYAFDFETGYQRDDPTKEPSIHFTLFFNTFVFMQLFNEINCRKLRCDEWNVFTNFQNNNIFHIVLAITLMAQVLIVELGGKALMTKPIGVTNYIICIIAGAGALGWGVLFRILTYHIRRHRAKQDNELIEKIQ